MRNKTDSKETTLRTLTRMKFDQHIPGTAGFMFALCMLVLVLGVLWMTQNAFGDIVIGTWTVGWILLGAYFLYWLKYDLAVGEGCRPALRQVP